MKIEQEFVAKLLRVLRLGNRVGQAIRQIVADRLDENAKTDPVVAVIAKNLQAGQRIGAVLENFSALLGLFQKRQVGTESKLRRMRGKVPSTKLQAPEKHQVPSAKQPPRSL